MFASGGVVGSGGATFASEGVVGSLGGHARSGTFGRLGRFGGGATTPGARGPAGGEGGGADFCASHTPGRSGVLAAVPRHAARDAQQHAARHRPHAPTHEASSGGLPEASGFGAGSVAAGARDRDRNRNRKPKPRGVEDVPGSIFCVYRVGGFVRRRPRRRRGRGRSIAIGRPGPVAATRGGSSSDCLRAERPTSTGAGDDGVARGRRDRGSAVRVDVRHEGRGGRGARRLGADRGWRGGRRNARRGVASPRASRARGSPAARIASRIASVAAPTRRRFVRPTARIRRKGTPPPGAGRGPKCTRRDRRGNRRESPRARRSRGRHFTRSRAHLMRCKFVGRRDRRGVKNSKGFARVFG